MAAGVRGTSNLNTLTRAVAGISRAESDDTVARAAVRVLLAAYDREDHVAGRRCCTARCVTCGGPESKG